MLLRHTLLYLPAQVLGPAVQFASILIWAHLLDPASLGLATLIIAIQEFSSVTFFGWWSHYALRFIQGYREPQQRREFDRTETVALAACLLVSTACLIPAVALYFGDRLTARDLGLVAAFLASRSLVTYLSERARAEARIALYTKIQVAAPLAGLVLGLVFMWLQGYTFQPVLLGFVVSNGVICVFGFAAIGLRGRLGLPDVDIMRRACSFGFPLIFGGMFVLVALNAPRFIVERFLGLEAAGRFAVGYGLGLRASSFAVMLVTAGAYPLVIKQLEQHGLAAAYAQLRTNIKLIVAAVAPVALGLLAVNQSVVDIFVPEDLRTVTYLILPLATAAGLLRSLRAHTVDQVFLVRSRSGLLTIIAVADMVIAVGATFAAVHYSGLAGAGYAPLVTSVATLIISALMTAAIFDFRLPWIAIGKLLAAAVVMAVCVGIWPKTGDLFGLAWRVAFGAMVYGVLVLVLMREYREPILVQWRNVKLSLARRVAGASVEPDR